MRAEQILGRKEIPLLFDENGVSLAFLFGSIINSATPRDVDIAVLFKNYSFVAYLKSLERLQKALKVKDIDLVVLNRSNARVKLEALLKGVLLFAPDEGSLSDFATDAFLEYEDYRYFKNEYASCLEKRISEGLSMAERKINRERVETYLSRLDEAVGELSRLRKRFSSSEI